MHNNNYSRSLAHVLNCFETYCTSKSILPTPLKNDESTTKVISMHKVFPSSFIFEKSLGSI